jgi:hypothetical protein
VIDGAAHVADLVALAPLPQVAEEPLGEIAIARHDVAFYRECDPQAAKTLRERSVFLFARYDLGLG